MLAARYLRRNTTPRTILLYMKQCCKNTVAIRNVKNCRTLSTDVTDHKLKGLTQSYEDQEIKKKELDIISLTKVKKDEETKNLSFASLLRRSPFMSLGDFTGKLITGEVVQIVDDNLFIDYGGKFLCVCKRPREGGENVKTGTKLVIKLLEWELSARFLGATTDVTLLESEATIVKVFSGEKKWKTSQTPTQHTVNE